MYTNATELTCDESCSDIQTNKAVFINECRYNIRSTTTGTVGNVRGDEWLDRVDEPFSSELGTGNGGSGIGFGKGKEVFARLAGQAKFGRCLVKFPDIDCHAVTALDGRLVSCGTSIRAVPFVDLTDLVGFEQHDRGVFARGA